MKYDSMPKLFLLLFTFSIRKLIFLTKNCINSSYSHFPSGHVVGDFLRGQLPEDKWFPWNPPAHRRKKALLYLLSCGHFGDLAS